MTSKARLVLRDCGEALKDVPGDSTSSGWRRWWAAEFALLRAVGHVLAKVDAETDPALGAVIDKQFRLLKESRPEPAIFWGFIEQERNNVLKEYRFKGPVIQGFGVKWVSTTDPETGKLYTIEGPERGQELSMYATQGPFAGREMFDLVREAIGWWNGYLDRIDALARGATSG